MSQVVDLDAWLAGSDTAFPQVEQGACDADTEAPAPIPKLPVDRRRRPLPSGRANDRYIGERL